MLIQCLSVEFDTKAHAHKPTGLPKLVSRRYSVGPTPQGDDYFTPPSTCRPIYSCGVTKEINVPDISRRRLRRVRRSAINATERVNDIIPCGGYLSIYCGYRPVIGHAACDKSSREFSIDSRWRISWSGV